MTRKTIFFSNIDREIKRTAKNQVKFFERTGGACAPTEKIKLGCFGVPFRMDKCNYKKEMWWPMMTTSRVEQWHSGE